VWVCGGGGVGGYVANELFSHIPQCINNHIIRPPAAVQRCKIYRFIHELIMYVKIGEIYRCCHCTVAWKLTWTYTTGVSRYIVQIVLAHYLLLYVDNGLYKAFTQYGFFVISIYLYEWQGLAIYCWWIYSGYYPGEPFASHG
jgi:hypothetical protein